ncbi:hypothetical protein [Pararhodobacter marinus]|uniref:hypothetical protein n=1 Tax=Pararhodobacter marinus TaxID=2184063 RepID=UPI0035131373
MSPKTFTFKQMLAGASKPAPSKKNPEQKASRKAVLAERKRIATILSHACPQTVAEAARLACYTDTTAEEAAVHLLAARKRAAAREGKASSQTEALPPELKAVQQRRLRQPQK